MYAASFLSVLSVRAASVRAAFESSCTPSRTVTTLDGSSSYYTPSPNASQTYIHTTGDAGGARNCQEDSGGQQRVAHCQRGRKGVTQVRWGAPGGHQGGLGGGAARCCGCTTAASGAPPTRGPRCHSGAGTEGILLCTAAVHLQAHRCPCAAAACAVSKSTMPSESDS